LSFAHISSCSAAMPTWRSAADSFTTSTSVAVAEAVAGAVAVTRQHGPRSGAYTRSFLSST
jgi:hypothetical protein